MVCDNHDRALGDRSPYDLDALEDCGCPTGQTGYDSRKHGLPTTRLVPACLGSAWERGLDDSLRENARARGVQQGEPVWPRRSSGNGVIGGPAVPGQ